MAVILGFAFCYCVVMPVIDYIYQSIQNLRGK